MHILLWTQRLLVLFIFKNFRFLLVGLFIYLLSTLNSSGSKGDISQGGSWFHSLYKVENIDPMAFKFRVIVKILHRKINKDYPEETMNNFPDDTHIFINSDKKGKNIYTIRYNYNFSKVLSFIYTPGMGYSRWSVSYNHILNYHFLEIHTRLGGVITAVMFVFVFFLEPRLFIIYFIIYIFTWRIIQGSMIWVYKRRGWWKMRILGL